jgi:acyl-CoA reductase-like NAD-dependent aldehyde dehydrogenase
MATSRALKSLYPYFLGRKQVADKSRTLKVLNKYTGKVATEVSCPTPAIIKEAFSNAAKSAPVLKTLPNFQRKEILLSLAQQIQERREELVHVLAIEAGKPLKDARAEVDRAVDTVTISAEESVRIGGEYFPLDISKRNQGYTALTSRFPVGVVSMIVPFNFPVNLAMHKIGPAIAAGCPFVLKPSDRTPVSSAILGEMLSNTSLPEGSFSILPTLHEDAHHFSTDANIKLISFTGSVGVGWKVKQTAEKKKVLLELGGNAACIVDKDADVARVVDRLNFGAFYYSGQSCISVQRIYIHEDIYDQVVPKLVNAAKQLKMGDPLDENTFIGPVISENDATRLEKWTQNAVAGGAKLLTGGKRHNYIFEPTIVEDVNHTCELSCREAFGPVCTVEKFKDFKAVIDKVNNSDYGLQAGLFTKDIHKIFYAYNQLEVGGVVVNDIPSARVDSMPYGGVKDSGLGREGVKYAIEEMTEMKTLLMKDIDKM